MRRRLASLLSAALLGTALMMTAPASPASAQGICAGVFGVATLGADLRYPVVPVTVAPPVQTGFAVSFVVGTCVNVPGVVKSLSAVGILSGWCGHSSGTGIANTGEQFAWVSAAHLMVITGELTGVANVVPDTLNGESCVSGADTFLVSPVAVKSACTLVVVSLGSTTTGVPVVGGTHTLYHHICI